MAKKKSKNKLKKISNKFLMYSGVVLWIYIGYMLIDGQVKIDITSYIDFISTTTAETGETTLDKCVDGDTAWFYINGESTKVRFLYVDTPESTTELEPYGKEASEYTCNMLTNAEKIWLEYDGEKVDKYGRTLAWIFVIDNNGNELLVQEQLAKNGFVEKYYDYGDYKYEYRINNALNDKYNIFQQ